MSDGVDEAGKESFPASDSPAPGSGDDEAAPVVFSAADGGNGRPSKPVPVSSADRGEFVLDHGAVVIASITSCTNTSNPSVMLGAALLAKNAVEKGLTVKPWVKTSMAPGSKVVTDYYEKAGLWPYLEKLGYHLVGYGCTTCIGNSGPLSEEISAVVNDNDLTVVSVLSGNRNFEGRINPDVKMNYLASPPLVIAYALAGTMDFDFAEQPLGTGSDGEPVYLQDIWPSAADVQSVDRRGDQRGHVHRRATPTSSQATSGGARCRRPEGSTFEWDPDSTYVRKPPYFDGMEMEPAPVEDIAGARVLALLGDSVTTDHISPAGSIKADTPAGQYLDRARRREARLQLLRQPPRQPRGDDPRHVRQHPAAQPAAGRRLRRLHPRLHRRGRPQAFIYDAAQNYAAAGTPLVVLGGKEYGSGSSRDWAAKGTALLGVKAVIVESYERIHRSNLIGMGVLPLQFPDGETAASLGLDGTETFTITGVTALNDGSTPRTVHVSAAKESGETVEFDARVRIDTPGEADYYRNGGIMQYVLRGMLA